MNEEKFDEELKGKRGIEAVPGGPAAVAGITGEGVHCGLKQKPLLDLALFVSDSPCKTAAFYTTNKLLGAHIPVFREKLTASHGVVRALLVNSKNANCSTGESGIRDNFEVASELAAKLGLKHDSVLFASTGVIGTPLPVGKIVGSFDALVEGLSKEGVEHAARAIMTTDTRPKLFSVRARLKGKVFHVGGVAKGSGMIAPNMATMFSFIFTDAELPTGLLRKISKRCVDNSFNSMAVDGDMSPNDTVLVMANGASGVKISAADPASVKKFEEALEAVMVRLSMEIVSDGEGATKLVHIKVRSASKTADARRIAKAIALSPLVKTAIFGCDPNWGRIISAAGASGAKFDPDRARLDIDGVRVFDRGGIPAHNGDIMKNKDVKIVLDCGIGAAAADFWTCDFSYDYVKINAEYTT